MANQAARVLTHLQLHGTITADEAQRKYGIRQLPRRIFDLRRLGYRIPMTKRPGKNCLGEPVSYGVYRYEGRREISA